VSNLDRCLALVWWFTFTENYATMVNRITCRGPDKGSSHSTSTPIVTVSTISASAWSVHFDLCGAFDLDPLPFAGFLVFLSSLGSSPFVLGPPSGCHS